MALRVLHQAGSAVSEFYADLSRLYAADCLAATADPRRYEFRIAWVSPDGRWRFPADLGDRAIDAAEPLPVSEALRRLHDWAPDVVVPQMFCVPGMTAYRALFDVLGVPYVGNTADVMALGADKAKARAIVAAAGVDVPPGQLVRPGDTVDVRPPAVVKPVDADNSIGVTLVRDAAGYGAALAEAFAHSGAALVETYVELGREVRCGVLERDGELICLPLEEYRVDPVTKPVRPALDKIARTGGTGGTGGTDGSGLRLVAKDDAHAWIVDPDDPVTAGVWAAARRCHVALGCRDYSLFDFRIDPDGRPWFLEASLYNSFARQSVLTVMAAAAGIGVAELFADALDRACRRAVGRRPGVR